MGLSIIDGALATREERIDPAGAICPLYGRLFRRACRLCKPCASRCENQALAAQERDYLAAWPSTRDDDHSLLAEWLRAKARAVGVDWLVQARPAGAPLVQGPARGRHYGGDHPGHGHPLRMALCVATRDVTVP
jgi:hypothetical protein